MSQRPAQCWELEVWHKWKLLVHTNRLKPYLAPDTNHFGERNPLDAISTSNTLFQILVIWVTILVWPFSVSQHHLLYSSIHQEMPQHVLLGMVQNFMSHVRQQQFFCFVSSKWGSKRSYQFQFLRFGAATFSTMYPNRRGKIPIAPQYPKWLLKSNFCSDNHLKMS